MTNRKEKLLLITIFSVVLLSSIILFNYNELKNSLKIKDVILKTKEDQIEMLNQKQNELEKDLKVYLNDSYKPINFEVLKVIKVSENFYYDFTIIEDIDNKLSEVINEKDIKNLFKEVSKLKGVGILGEDKEGYYFYVGLGKRPTQDYNCDIEVFEYNKDVDQFRILVGENMGERHIDTEDTETYLSLLVKVNKNYLINESKMNNFNIIFKNLISNNK